MLTETDFEEDRRDEPPRKKSKRERRRERARALGAKECTLRACHHAAADHQNTAVSGTRYCHVCMDICTSI